MSFFDKIEDSRLIYVWLWAVVCKIRRLVGRHLTSDMNELGDSGLDRDKPVDSIK